MKRVAGATPGGRTAEPSTRTAPGDRIYAIGDVHGCLDLLKGLIKRVRDHEATLPRARATHVVLLGDLIDRGAQSAHVLDYVYERRARDPGMIVLLGNHEELMLRTLDGEPGMLRAWLRAGGRQTVESFGLTPPHRDEDPVPFLEALRRTIPKEWVKWLRGLPLTARSGDYVFCHAGVRPGIAFKRQARNDLLWIRDDFLFDERPHDGIVVHGHSVEETVEMRTNRIGIDTGAYRSGVLTALYLEGSAREIIATAAPAG